MIAHPTLAQLVEAAAEHFLISANDIFSNGRHYTVSRARWVYAAAALSTGRFSHPEIVRGIHHRAHSIVGHSARMIRKYPELAEAVTAVVARARQMAQESSTPSPTAPTVPEPLSTLDHMVVKELARKMNAILACIRRLEDQVNELAARAAEVG